MNLKRFLLRALSRMSGLPLGDAQLRDTAALALVPVPLVCDVTVALRELEADGFIAGHRDDLDGVLTWTLTDKGQHKAKQF